MTKRVLILSASSGLGHIRAAEALKHSFEASNANVQVRHEDALNFTSDVFRDICTKQYISFSESFPEFLGWLYDRVDTSWQSAGVMQAFEQMHMRQFLSLLKDYRPDAVICTHFLPAALISRLICKSLLRTHHFIALTDFDVHTMWLCHHYSHYFVPLAETKEYMSLLGFDPKRTIVSGVPINPVFAQNKGKIEMRIKHDLDPDKLTILVSSGGWGIGPNEEILSSLVTINRPCQIVVACGYNEKLRKRLSLLPQTVLKGSQATISAIGITDHMDEYMEASDFIVGKSGGLTVSESLAKGLPFVIVHPVPGQEERNKDHLLEEGAAICCNNLPALAYKIESLIDNPDKLALLKQNIVRLASPKSAETITSQVLQVIQKAHIMKPCPGNHAYKTKAMAINQELTERFKTASNVWLGRVAAFDDG